MRLEVEYGKGGLFLPKESRGFFQLTVVVRQEGGQAQRLSKYFSQTPPKSLTHTRSSQERMMLHHQNDNNVCMQTLHKCNNNGVLLRKGMRFF